MEKYYRANKATVDNMVYTHCMMEPKATNTHSKYIILITLHCNNGCTNTSQSSVLHTVPVLV